MRTIGRFFKEAFWDMPQVMLAWSYIIVVVFVYGCQRFLSPYTSVSESRINELGKEVKRELQELQDKLTRN